MLGGTLHQKVHEVEGYHDHRENPDDPIDVMYGPSHPVDLVEGGMLHKMAGATRVTVNSLHSQGVARLPRGVTVEAIADDGLIVGRDRVVRRGRAAQGDVGLRAGAVDAPHHRLHRLAAGDAAGG